MKAARNVFVLLAMTVLVSSCKLNAETHTPVQVAQALNTPNSNYKLSKYSPKNYQVVSDPNEKDDDFTDPSKTLGVQSTYTVFNPRHHLIDRFIDNTPPDRIELKNWKYDFIAGDLALDQLDFSEAKSMYEMALAEAQKQSGDTKAKQTGLAKVRLGYIMRKTGNAQESESYYKQALQSLRAVNSAEPDTNINKAIDLALRELALLAWKTNRPVEAETYLRERIANAKSMYGKFCPTVAYTENELANILYYQRKLDDADKIYLHCYMVAQRFKEDSDRTNYAAWNWADCRFEQGRHADAMALYQKSGSWRGAKNRILECENYLVTAPASERKPFTLPASTGNKVVWQELLDTALHQFKMEQRWTANKIAAAAEAEIKHSGDSKLMAQTKLVQADITMADNPQTALPLYKDSVEQSATAGDKALRSAAMGKLLVCQIAAKDYSGIQATYKSLQQIADAKAWSELTSSLTKLCNEKHLYDVPPTAIATLVEVGNQCVTAAPENSMEKAAALNNLARMYELDKKQSEKALGLYGQAIAVGEKAKDKQENLLQQIKANFGMRCMFNQHYKEAEPLFQDVLAYAEMHPGKENRNLRSAVQHMSALYNNWGRSDLEEKYYLRSMALEEEQIPSFATSHKLSHLSNLCRISIRRGDAEKCEAYLKEAIALGANNNDLSSMRRDLSSLYQRLGMYDKLAQISMAEASGQTGDAKLQNLYHAALYSFQAGDYSGARKMISDVVSEMEVSNQTQDKDFGCYFKEPRYSQCVLLLGNCTLDGDANYDKALSIYDKMAMAYQPDDAADRTMNRRGPGIHGPRYRSIDELLNLLICCDAIGNAARAQELRTELKGRLEQNLTAQKRQPGYKDNPIFTQTTALIDKSKRSRSDEITLMELIPQCLNPQKMYSSAEGAELLERALVLREKNNDKVAVKTDYATLVEIYTNSRRFEKAEPICMMQQRWLRSNSADKADIVNAKLNFGIVLMQRGDFPTSQRLLSELTSDEQLLSKENQFALYKNLADNAAHSEDYANAIKFCEKAATLVDPQSKDWRLITAQIGTLKDLVGKHDEALALYKTAIAGDDAYAILEPLRKASERESQNKQFKSAEYLFRREIALLALPPANPEKAAIGISNAWMQMARMYRFANMKPQSEQAYLGAIAALKVNDKDSFCRSQIASAEREITEMKKQPD